MPILPQIIYTFNAIPIKIPTAFFTEPEQTILTFLWNQKTPNSQSNLEKEKQSCRHHNSGLEVVLQSCSHQDSMLLAKSKHIHQWNRIEYTEINPQVYSQVIFHKAGKTIQWKKDSLFNKWCWENWTATCKRMTLNCFLTPYTKINSNRLKT